MVRASTPLVSETCVRKCAMAWHREQSEQLEADASKQQQKQQQQRRDLHEQRMKSITQTNGSINNERVREQQQQQQHDADSPAPLAVVNAHISTRMQPTRQDNCARHRNRPTNSAIDAGSSSTHLTGSRHSAVSFAASRLSLSAAPIRR